MPTCATVAHVLAERTDGNPFYVGALWEHLVARGAVVAHDGRFSVRSVAAAGDVPDSVREVIAARLGRLSPVARRLVDLAAIAGMQVELAVLELAAGTDGMTAADVSAGTEELVAAGLLTVRARAPVRRTASRTRSCATPSPWRSRRVGDPACTSPSPAGWSRCTSPIPAPSWPTWLDTSEPPSRSGRPTGRSSTDGGRPGRRSVRRRTTKPSPTSWPCSSSPSNRRTAPSCWSTSASPTYATGSTSHRCGPTARHSSWRSRPVLSTPPPAAAVGLRVGDPLPGPARRPGRRAARSGHRARRRQPDGGANPAQGVVRPGARHRRSHRGGRGDGGIDDRRRPRDRRPGEPHRRAAGAA